VENFEFWMFSCMIFWEMAPHFDFEILNLSILYFSNMGFFYKMLNIFLHSTLTFWLTTGFQGREHLLSHICKNSFLTSSAVVFVLDTTLFSKPSFLSAL